MGRVTRGWWKRLTPERRRAIKEAIGRQKKLIYGGVGLFCVGGVGYYYWHLEETPITGRRRFMMFRRHDVIQLVEAEKEVLMQMMFADKQLLPNSDPTYLQVLSVTNAILSKNWSKHFEDLNWTLYVINDPKTVNAICLPSGEIFVFTGLIKACRNQNELAFILSQEIAHAVLGHGAEKLSHRGIWEFIGLFFIAALWAVIPNDLVSYFLHRFSHETAEVLFDYPYSRLLETEADEVGLLFAASACFDPEEASKIWTHLCVFNENDVEYLSTHPSNERRYEALSVLLPTAHAVWKKGECEKEMREEVESFQKSVKKVLKDMIKLW